MGCPWPALAALEGHCAEYKYSPSVEISSDFPRSDPDLPKVLIRGFSWSASPRRSGDAVPAIARDPDQTANPGPAANLASMR
jgi:hypothetical protein